MATRTIRPTIPPSNGHQHREKPLRGLDLLDALDHDPALKKEIAAEEREREKLQKEDGSRAPTAEELEHRPSRRRSHPSQETPSTTKSQTPRYRYNTLREEWAELKAGRRQWGEKWFEIYHYLPTTLATRVVLMALVLFWKEKGQKSPTAWPGWRTLSRVTGMAQQNISRALKTLVRLGVLTVEHHGQNAAVYTFAHPSAFPVEVRRQAWKDFQARCRRTNRTSFRHRQPHSAR